MKYLVVILFVAACAGSASAAVASCAPSEEFFARHNISADNQNEPGANITKGLYDMESDENRSTNSCRHSVEYFLYN